MAVAQFKVAEQEAEILDIINRLEKIGWSNIKAKAIRDKFNEYHITISGTSTNISGKNIDGRENAIFTSVNRHYPNAVVKITLPTEKALASTASTPKAKLNKLASFLMTENKIH